MQQELSMNGSPLPGSTPVRRRRPSVGGAAKAALRRLLHPGHAFGFFRRLWPAPRIAKSTDDPQLALYAEILPGGFLNYGYFDDPDVPPEQISLQSIQMAQVRYGRLLVEKVHDLAGRVLDAGCGMGGLVNLLLERGCAPTALTPAPDQIRFMQSRYPTVPLIESRFEAIPIERYRQHFATVIMSESLQYMKLPRTLPAVREILAPGGRWIVCDYFRLREGIRRSGHRWQEFQSAVLADGWKIVEQRDITAHALPTIRFLHTVGQRVGLPALGFALGKFRRRRPALHYLFEHFLADVRGFAEQQLDALNPDTFRQEKAYMLLVLERA